MRRNREALLQFWNEGESWSIREMNALAQHLKKLDGLLRVDVDQQQPSASL